MKPVRITTFSLDKGGVGKTTIALNLSYHFNCGIITNQKYTLLGKILPKENFLNLAKNQDIPQISQEHNIIFDMGGYVDNRVISAAKQSNYIVIPTTSSDLDLQGCISAIQEIKDVNNNIVIILNKTEDKNELIEAKEFISKIGNYPIFEIKKSKIMQNITREKKSINQISESGGLKAYQVKSLSKQWNDIINFINK